MKSNHSTTLRSYQASVFCTACSAEIRTEGGWKSQKPETVCDDQADTWVKDTLWWLLLADKTHMNRTSDAQHPWKKVEKTALKLNGRHLKHANISLTFLKSWDQPLWSRFFSAYCEDSETTNHIPDRSWQPQGLKCLFFADEVFSCDQVKQLQALTSRSQVPETFREKGRLVRASSDQVVVLQVEIVTPCSGDSAWLQKAALDKGVSSTWKERSSTTWKHS